MHLDRVRGGKNALTLVAANLPRRQTMAEDVRGEHHREHEKHPMGMRKALGGDSEGARAADLRRQCSSTSTLSTHNNRGERESELRQVVDWCRDSARQGKIILMGSSITPLLRQRPCSHGRCWRRGMAGSP